MVVYIEAGVTNVIMGTRQHELHISASGYFADYDIQSLVNVMMTANPIAARLGLID